MTFTLLDVILFGFALVFANAAVFLLLKANGAERRFHDAECQLRESYERIHFLERRHGEVSAERDAARAAVVKTSGLTEYIQETF